MHTDDKQWVGHSVLVLSCGHPLGRAIARILRSRGAEVIGHVSSPHEGLLLQAEHQPGRFWPIYGRVDDVFRLYSAIAVHDVSAVFLVSGPYLGGHNTRGQWAIRRALKLYGRRVIFVCTGPAEAGPASADAIADPIIPYGIARFEELFGLEGQIIETEADLPLDVSPAQHRRVSDQRRDHVFLDDAARAMLLVAEQLTQGSPNLDASFRSGWTFTESEWQQLLEHVKRDPGFGLHVQNQAQGLLGWKPARSLIETLREVLHHPVGPHTGLNAPHTSTSRDRRKAA